MSSSGDHSQLLDTLAGADPFQSWWPFVVAIAVGVVMTIRGYMGGVMNPSADVQLTGRVIIVTGASGGIGLQIASDLCRRGASVILACRDLPKAQRALDVLRSALPAGAAEVRHLDLGSLASVRHFAAGIVADFPAIHGLCNNAGVNLMAVQRAPQMTGDGFERHLQVNYLGAVLLTELLAERLRRGRARVVNTAGHAYAAACQHVQPADPLNVGEWWRAYHPREEFARSKLLMVLWTQAKAAELLAAAAAADDEAGDADGWTVNAYTPGFVRGTEHLRQSPVMRSLFAKWMIYPWLWTFLKTPVQGAQTAVWLLSAPSLAGVSGKYFNDCELAELLPLASDDTLVAKAAAETRRVLKL